MKTNIFILISTLALILFSSCEKAILGPDEVNDPENNFELFWGDFDKHYGIFEARGWNWDSIYTTYRPQVTAQTTDDQLWDICSDMIEYLDDGHTFIHDPEKERFKESGSAIGDQALEEFSLDLVEDKYLDELIPAGGRQFSYGKIKSKDIGYIYLGAMDDNDPDMIDDVMDKLRDHKALIVDIRNNGGGEDEFSERIAGAFADGKHFIYTVQTRNGPKHDDFTEKKSYYSHKQGKSQYLKPIVILTDRYKVSAADIFMLHMKSFAHVTQIGDSTAGDYSDNGMRRFLPNGWMYQFSIMMYLMPDGSTQDGIGSVPEIQFKNTKADIEAGNDKVLERTFLYFFEEYGIE